jgi:hypothetical protein
MGEGARFFWLAPWVHGDEALAFAAAEASSALESDRCSFDSFCGSRPELELPPAPLLVNLDDLSTRCCESLPPLPPWECSLLLDRKERLNILANVAWGCPGSGKIGIGEVVVVCGVGGKSLIGTLGGRNGRSRIANEGKMGRGPRFADRAIRILRGVSTKRATEGAKKRISRKAEKKPRRRRGKKE